MRKLRALAATLLVGAMLTTTGCFGKFTLVQKVWGVNNSLGNKFLNTLLFWVFCIIPVYEVAAFVDAIIFNLIEFWTGNNPLAMQEGETLERVAEVNGKPLKLTFSNRGQDVTIDADGRIFKLHVDESSAVLHDGAGQLVTESRQLADGAFEVRNAAGEVVTGKTAAESRGWASLLRSGTDVFVQQLAVERGTRYASAK